MVGPAARADGGFEFKDEEGLGGEFVVPDFDCPVLGAGHEDVGVEGGPFYCFDGGVVGGDDVEVAGGMGRVDHS